MCSSDLFLSGHEVREIYPNKYITVDDRIYVYYTLFNLPEIYLIACLIDYLSTVSTYVEWVIFVDKQK